MRAFQLFEQNQDTITLYRGDSSPVDYFSTDYTKKSIGLLFGPGIYLTDNPAVARDYARKGSDSAIGPADSEYALQQQMLREWVEAHPEYNEIKEKYSRAWWDWIGDNANASREQEREFREQLQKDLRAELKVLLRQAKKEIEKRLENYRLMHLTTNEFFYVPDDGLGELSVFEVPVGLVKATVCGDEPASDAVIKIIHDSLVQHRGKDYRMGLRDKEHGIFDGNLLEWVKYVKTNPVKYAWVDDHMIGGKGENPSLDDLINGTYAALAQYGTGEDNRIWDTVMKRMMADGITGVEYKGGQRTLGGTLKRGGGGVFHRAFVFWNDVEINKYRVKRMKPDVEPVTFKVAKARVKSTLDF